MATGRRVPDVGPPVCSVEGAVPASRVLLAASANARVIGQLVLRDLAGLRSPQLGFASATLFFRDRPGPERSGGRFWESQGGRVAEVDDVVAAVERVDVVAAFVVDLDPGVMAVLGRADEVGVPVLLRHVGPYPFPPGSEQAERAAEARALRGHG